MKDVEPLMPQAAAAPAAAPNALHSALQEAYGDDFMGLVREGLREADRDLAKLESEPTATVAHKIKGCLAMLMLKEASAAAAAVEAALRDGVDEQHVRTKVRELHAAFEEARGLLSPSNAEPEPARRHLARPEGEVRPRCSRPRCP